MPHVLAAGAIKRAPILRGTLIAFNGTGTLHIRRATTRVQGATGARTALPTGTPLITMAQLPMEIRGLALALLTAVQQPIKASTARGIRTSELATHTAATKTRSSPDPLIRGVGGVGPRCGLGHPSTTNQGERDDGTGHSYVDLAARSCWVR